MSNALKLSLIANVILAGALGWFARYQLIKTGSPRVLSASQATEAKPEPKLAQTSSEVKRGIVAERFQWSQLESSDYRTYIANLRGIGCPQQTIRDLITADVDGLYAVRREKVKQKYAVPADSPNGSFAFGQSAASELRELQSEEASVLAGLLGPQPASVQVSADAPPPRLLRKVAQPISMPLVMQNIDLSALNLNSRQVEVVNELRQRFQDEIGGQNQDPNDPAYTERWRTAQRNSDEMLQGMLGAGIYLAYQSIAFQNQQLHATK
ncbi:MAG TPA: hypothetical protein VNZ64_09810 [Candidatus Acidoferrum sp.]|jgi:hypothetical protein|nr:hypothetical protein [Candidatus Acidoferrum sp.]